MESALQPFFEDNIDVALINIGQSRLDYRLVVVSADYVMDAASADAIRNYVRNGGTVIKWMRTISGSIRRFRAG